MKRVGIAEFKAHLSEHLRSVRRGQSLTLLDRNTPIARVVPEGGEAPPLAIRGPSRKLSEVRFPPPLKPTVDIVELLLEERQNAR